jgi:DNA-3-methyladenine glycosylase II
LGNWGYSGAVSAFSRSLRKAERVLAENDAALARVIARVGPSKLELSEDFDPFHALVRSICHQQLHGKAAETILGRVNTRFGDGHLADLKRVHRARLDSLRKCGLSLAKALAVKDLAAKCLDGTVPTAKALNGMPDDEIVERITEVRGIGRWTVEMMLMFRLGRLDVWPVDDFGVRKGYTLLRRLEAPITPRRLLPLGEVWRPYRSVASWYLWRVAENGS